jgi:methionyl-tRNA formyltransferase
MAPRRIIFFGTAELARSSLDALAAAPQFGLLGVVTQPDRPRGRDLKCQPPPVKAAALRWGLPVWQPEKCRHPDFIQQVASLKPDLIVVAAYGQILPPALLSLPPHGCVNVHASMLPKYRGAAPIQWAILNDETETGITIMQMDAGLDTGAILTVATTPITLDDNARTLHDRLAQLGAELLVRTLPDYLAGRLTPQPQPTEGATYARKISKEDGRLDWTRPAREVWNRIRGLNPWPGTYTYLAAAPRPRLLKIHAASVGLATGGAPGEILSADRTGLVVACGQGAVGLTEVQREGGRRLTVAEFLAGHPLRPGQRLVANPAGN